MSALSRRQFLKYGLRFGFLGLAAAYPVFLERSIVLTTFYRIAVPNLPEEFSGFRIVHLTDLHYGLLVPLELIQDVVQRANRLKPDIIVCTGDYVHEMNSTRQIDLLWPVLGKLVATSGVYSVLGNHDHWADTERSVYWLKRTGQDMRHKCVRLERQGKRIWLAGAGDFLEDHRDLDGMLSDVPDSDCRILLAHNPDTVDTGYTSRIDLTIAGHTHGGQVVIPLFGPPFLPVRNKAYTSGLTHSLRGSTVFISRGIGWTHVPVRFNCYPEIAVLELVPERNRGGNGRQ